MQFNVIGIKYWKWQNTIWKGIILPIEIDHPEISEYKNRHLVKIYGKGLGLIPRDQENLPIGTQVFAKLENKNNYVLVTLVDKPVGWKPFLYDGFPNIISEEAANELYDPYFAKEALGDNYFDPINLRFHEWIIRRGYDPDHYERLEDGNDSDIYKYTNFRYWLSEIHKVFENEYDDRDLKLYEEYVEREIRKQEILDRIGWEWESEQDERMEIESQYGKGAYMDESGAVFSDEHEFLGID